MVDRRQCLEYLQSFLKEPPLIILGSGSSAPYGLPLMSDLQQGILSDERFSAGEYSTLRERLKELPLEEALDESDLADELSNCVRDYVWDSVSNKDRMFFSRLIGRECSFPLADLLRKILETATKKATVVTTNYDRIAEYAADLIGATSITGFEGSFIKRFELPSPGVRRTRSQNRESRVNIWKVHGSLDWFVSSTGEVVSYPFTSIVPIGHVPLIVPPGRNKYLDTHGNPYRDIIAQADIAFSRANSFICIGYGFNDKHIQPKLIDEIKKGKPIVVLCYKVTPSCMEHVASPEIKKYAILDCAPNPSGGTRVTSSFNDNRSENYDGDLWSLEGFLKNVWGVTQ